MKLEETTRNCEDRPGGEPSGDASVPDAGGTRQVLQRERDRRHCVYTNGLFKCSGERSSDYRAR